jgi:hypothetical protein
VLGIGDLEVFEDGFDPCCPACEMSNWKSKLRGGRYWSSELKKIRGQRILHPDEI